MKKLILAIALIVPGISDACHSDYECGYGNRCVKPSGSFSASGTCVVPTDSYGTIDYDSSYRDWGKNYGPTEIKGCSFNTDCGIGFKCLKESGQLQGICVK